MRGASNPDGRTAALDCFASLAMTDRKLAHLFLRVAFHCLAGAVDVAAPVIFSLVEVSGQRVVWLTR